MKPIYSIFLLLGIFVNAQQTYVPDINFELQLIALGYDSGSPDSYVLTENINTIETLNLSNSYIENTEGIQDFIALTSLDISFSTITSIDVSTLVNLTYINFNDTEIVNIDLTNNILLTTIGASYTFLEALDVTENTLLEYLNIDGSTSIHYLDLSNNAFLQTFISATNNIGSLDFSNCPNLTSLHITGGAANLNLANGNNENITYLILNLISAQCVTVDNDTLANDWNSGINLPDSYQTNDSTITYTSQPCPQNDFSYSASSLQIGNTFEDFPLIGNNEFASASSTYYASNPNYCEGNSSGYNGGDLWYKLIVPEDGAVVVETSYNNVSDILDTGMVIYNTVDYDLTLIACNDNINMSEGNYFSRIALTDLTAGEELHIRVWEYGNDAYGTFKIAAYTNAMVSTYIPDINFQQALIDLGIDTSPQVDGYVNTTEIATIESLDISNRNISDLTGIENFTGLINLNCGANTLESLDLSLNLSLTNLDTTNNPDLECIKVADVNAANNGSGVYANWLKDPSTIYSETCEGTLSLVNSNLETVSIYPNPINANLKINIPNGHILQHISILNTSGQLVGTYNKTSINISSFSSGLYFINIETNKGNVTKKIIKQ